MHYAGLPSHADHKLCKAYLGGCGGGVFSFDLHGSGVAAKQFLKVRMPCLRMRPAQDSCVHAPDQLAVMLHTCC